MSNTHAGLFVTHMPNIGEDFTNEGDAAGLPTPTNTGEPLGLMRANEVPQSRIHMSHTWIFETDSPQHWVNEHEHDYDEILIWTGTDPENPRDLGAELYFDIEGVRHSVTASGSVYIPAGTRHCPLGFVQVTRPFNFSALSLSPVYDSDENADLIPQAHAESAS
ncbi:hypothetical protein [Agromyces larvae]|uniref:Cupin n=1 Tax=Agromyces larvae TaxID=2929802 RepID=A0ABY4C6R2_9MICO|nr:hypothetical protein [Agromyces larvae]UOE44395.1 hypothetical protein MTO99_00960 [Agromyces larvae]